MIMRYTDEELHRMYSRSLERPRARDEMYRQTVAGRPWLTCPNCNSWYPVDRSGASLDTCSVHCRKEYAKYLLGLAEDMKRYTDNLERVGVE